MSEYVIAIIPVRGADKFTRTVVGGKTLLAHTIDAARASEKINAVIVSTDSAEVAAYAKELGAQVPFLRSAKLAAPGVRLEDVLQETVRELDQHGQHPTIVVSLEILHPLRPAGLLDKMISLLEENDFDTVFTVARMHDNIWRQDAAGKVLRFDEKSRREEREPIFRELLGIACVTRAKLISDGIRVGRTVGIVPVDEKTARIDVRTEEDAWLANQLLSKP